MADYDWRQPDEKGILDSYFGSFLVLLFGALLIGYGELISYKEEVHLHQYGLMTRLDSVDPGPVTFRSHTFFEMPDTIPHLPITEAYFKYL